MKGDFLTIADVINRLMTKHPNKDKLMECAIINSWEKVAPRVMQNDVKKIYVKDDSLYLGLGSSIIRHAVKLNKSRILEEMNSVNTHYQAKDILLI